MTDPALKVIGSLEHIGKDDWDDCAGTANPFFSHDFLSALEQSGCVSAETGWLPLHLGCFDQANQLIGAVPLYVKGHSQGEFVFDHEWAHAWQAAGGQYYPKLLAAIPFSPIAGPRLFCRQAADAAIVKPALAQGMITLCEQHGLSSVHALFLEDRDSAYLIQNGWLPRLDVQFHWHNEDYAHFDDFLTRLKSRKRKAINKERQAVRDAGVSLRRLAGDDISSADMDALFAFYMDTGSRKWGRPYLNRDFFAALQDKMADRLLLVMAYLDGTPIGGAINLIGQNCLFGRYWGCSMHIPYLHFEVSYYQAMEFAIEAKLKRVEAGAQGEHKLARGYMPVLTQSAHYIADAPFRQSLSAHLEEERHYVRALQERLATNSPYALPRH